MLQLSNIIRRVSSTSVSSTSVSSTRIISTTSILFNDGIDNNNESSSVKTKTKIPSHVPRPRPKTKQGFITSHPTYRPPNLPPYCSPLGGPFNNSTHLHPNTPNPTKCLLFRGLSLTLLGTSSGVPSLTRSNSSSVLKTLTSQILIDCGEGTQLQMQKTRNYICPHSINLILITHMHADHVFGLPGVLIGINVNRGQSIKSFSRKRKERKWPVKIVGPKGIYRYVVESVKQTRSSVSYLEVTVIELLEDNMEPTRDQNVKGFKVQGLHMKDGVWNIERREEFEGINQERFDGLGLEGVKDERERERILKEFLEGDVDLPTKAVSNQALSIRAAKVEHVQGMLCVGYTVEEGDPIPRINRDRAVALGVGEGKIYDCLKLGLTVKSDDGTRDVKLDDVILEAGSGRKVTFMGDCTFASKEMMSLAKGSDLVLHEATLGDSQENERTAKSRGHSVPRIAAEFGRRVGAKEVLLTHFSNRYNGFDSEDVKVSVSDPKNNAGALKVMKRIEEEEGRKMRLTWGCDLMEVVLRKERSEYVEHGDGIGQEYVDLMRVKEELEENRLEDLGKAVSAKSGWALKKNGSMVNATKAEMKEGDRMYYLLEQEKIDLLWDPDAGDWTCQECGARNTRRKKTCFKCNVSRASQQEAK
ncbi:hypothetical protein TrST_g11517 [Triparma strigata]|uniref:RanBP2-type domain-containing protein n=1 Tax=Triparma strigata TaxID=1606541 RepID=A0A9W7DY98_9STRA|nr:hypothetical protein TrST_g11517 [Triparma strigata]